jgi:hypothetical protein
MALIDMCLHDGVKLRYSTYGECVQPLQSVKIYPDRRVHGIGRVMVWFQQLDGF